MFVYRVRIIERENNEIMCPIYNQPIIYIFCLRSFNIVEKKIYNSRHKVRITREREQRFVN
ncbi:hypothetical protein Hdeb2414_s0003g00118651 [Helianthus debilis subsp. tardiflorus]